MASFSCGKTISAAPMAVSAVPTPGSMTRPNRFSYRMPSKMTQSPNGISNTDGRYRVNVHASGTGESQPPKNRMVARHETVIMLVYSAIKNIANLKLAYSVWNPATSSDSASGKSNGARFVSAIAATKKQAKPRICGQMFQLKIPCQPKIPGPDCASMIFFILKRPAISSTSTTDLVLDS